jgi:hypothetical protein
MDTTIVEIPKAWWSGFTDEPICDDANDHAAADSLERQTFRLLNAPVVSETKQVRRIEADEAMLTCLRQHADWFTYYWREQADQAWDREERMPWLALSMSSKAFDRKLRALAEV